MVELQVLGSSAVEAEGLESSGPLGQSIPCGVVAALGGGAFGVEGVLGASWAGGWLPAVEAR